MSPDATTTKTGDATSTGNPRITSTTPTISPTTRLGTRQIRLARRRLTRTALASSAPSAPRSGAATAEVAGVGRDASTPERGLRARPDEPCPDPPDPPDPDDPVPAPARVPTLAPPFP